MHIALLTRKPSLYSSSRIIEAAKARDIDILCVDVLGCTLIMSKDGPKLLHRGEPLPRIDVVIPRIAPSVTFTGVAVLRQMQMMGAAAVVKPEGVINSRDKLISLQIMAEAGIGIPASAMVGSKAEHASALSHVGGVPLIVKALSGTHGDGVELAESEDEVESLLDDFADNHQRAFLQQFIGEANGKDLRCFVVGGRVVAGMRREAQEGEFRSNVHRGAEVFEANLSAAERDTAVKAAKVLGMDVAGVDIVRSDDGPLVLEVNSSPGLEGIEKASGVDVAGEILDMIVTEYGDVRAPVA